MGSIMLRTFLAFLILAFAQGSISCDCASYTIEEAYNSYDVVFIGKVKSVREQSIFEGRKVFSDGLVGAKLIAERKFKGSTEKEIIVYTENDSASCGVSFEQNITYAVFAEIPKDAEDNKLYVNSCSPTVHTDARGDHQEDYREHILNYLNSKKEAIELPTQRNYND